AGVPLNCVHLSAASVQTPAADIEIVSRPNLQPHPAGQVPKVGVECLENAVGVLQSLFVGPTRRAVAAAERPSRDAMKLVPQNGRSHLPPTKLDHVLTPEKH